MKNLILLASILFSTLTLAGHTYYPQSFQDSLDNGNLKDEALRQAIKKVLKSSHSKHSNGPDTLGCNRGEGQCYSNINLGYKGARTHLFGNVELGHLEQVDGKYQLVDVYCQKKFTSGSAGTIGPRSIPNSNMLNCEHTWPQSKFTGSDSRFQKSDLHHLFPTDSKANSVRGNHDFGIVNSGRAPTSNCSASQATSRAYQPPFEHRGNVARAMFYFAVRYDGKINDKMESALRKWHEEDPVDQAEIDRNNAVYKVQNNRNPFIDYPNLIYKLKNL
ncbi:endonuclease I family protein [Halobacteriovorax sp. HLS]|uniref:endonuclease I family protein n=1 Tax=Halobacteriovorax sp. HLS TaxID=2234000 RepID=UPI000FD80D8B|nr:endonuclease [Halobacteriovorax sp. HLS]